jgi:hypothetical protein
MRMQTVQFEKAPFKLTNELVDVMEMRAPPPSLTNSNTDAVHSVTVNAHTGEAAANARNRSSNVDAATVAHTTDTAAPGTAARAMPRRPTTSRTRARDADAPLTGRG